MCLRLSSREKKKNRNSPSLNTVGDKQAPPLASQHSLVSPSEAGKKLLQHISLVHGKGYTNTAVCIFPTLAITWPQGAPHEEDSLAVAAQVHGGVREWQVCQVQEVVTPSQSPSPLHLRIPAR